MADAVPPFWNGFLFAGGGVVPEKPQAPAIYGQRKEKMKKQALLIVLAGMTGVALADTVVDFDGQSTTGNNTYYRPTEDGTYDWTDKDATFSMQVDYDGAAWDGMTYSSVLDTTTPGYTNQYAVSGDGMGMGDGGSYAIFFQPFSNRSAITLPTATTVRGFYANNTTYAALAILNGEGSARAFTTESNDWFKLTIEGFDGTDNSLGMVDFLLADYTGETGELVDDWTFVDLASLGDNVKSLQFALSSTDNGAWGMNTPAYFAMDDLTVAAIPEPGTIALMLVGFGGMVGFRRRLKR